MLYNKETHSTKVVEFCALKNFACLSIFIFPHTQLLIYTYVQQKSCVYSTQKHTHTTCEVTPLQNSADNLRTDITTEILIVLGFARTNLVRFALLIKEKILKFFWQVIAWNSSQGIVNDIWKHIGMILINISLKIHTSLWFKFSENYPYPWLFQLTESWWATVHKSQPNFTKEKIINPLSLVSASSNCMIYIHCA